KVVFDAKQSLVALLKKGIHLQGMHFDVLLASYLLDPSENNHDIPAIAHRMGIKSVLYDEEVYGKGAKMKVPGQEILADHLVRKTKALHLLQEKMEEELREHEL